MSLRISGDAFRIPTGLLARLDIESALKEELSPRQDLPSRTIELAVSGHNQSAVAILRGLYRKGLTMTGAPEIQAFKGRSGLRPLTILTFSERVLYQALTALVASQ